MFESDTDRQRMLNRERQRRWRERNRELFNKRLREEYKPRYRDRLVILENLMRQKLMLQNRFAHEVKSLLRVLNGDTTD